LSPGARALGSQSNSIQSVRPVETHKHAQSLSNTIHGHHQSGISSRLGKNSMIKYYNTNGKKTGRFRTITPPLNIHSVGVVAALDRIRHSTETWTLHWQQSTIRTWLVAEAEVRETLIRGSDSKTRQAWCCGGNWRPSVGRELEA
jgi:hypothetical protein